MKFTKVFVILIVVIALLVPSEAAPGKIPIGAIKKAGKAIVSNSQNKSMCNVLQVRAGCQCYHFYQIFTLLFNIKF